MAQPWENYQQEAQGPWTEHQQPQTAMDKLGEMFTGSARQTQATQELPELADSGLLSGADKVAGVGTAMALATMSDPEEIAQMLTNTYPQVGITYDHKGNLIANNNETGARAVINQPGVSGQDFIQMLGLGALFTPTSIGINAPMIIAGREVAKTGIQKTGQAAIQSGLMSAGIETGQQLAGGNFDAEVVLLDTIGAGLFEAIPAGVRATLTRRVEAAAIRGEQALLDEQRRIIHELSPEAQGAVAAQQAQVSQDEARQQAQQVEDLAQRVTQAAQAKKPGEQLRELAIDVDADPRVIEAARQHGLESDLSPADVSQNQSFIDLYQSLSSIPNTTAGVLEKAKIVKVGKAADDIITQFNGSTDKAGLTIGIKDSIKGRLDDLHNQIEDAYSLAPVPKRSDVDYAPVEGFIQDKILDMRGDELLTAYEKQLMAKIDQGQGLSYGFIDAMRRKIGGQMRGKGTPYPDATSAELGGMYRLLTNVQEQAANAYSPEAKDAWSLGKSLVVQQKELQDKSVLLAGKELTGDIMAQVGHATTQLGKQRVEKFKKFMDAIPENMRQEVALTALNDAFTVGARNQKQINIPGFVGWYQGLQRSPTVKAELYKHLPADARKRLDSFYVVANAINNSLKSNISTGRIQGLLNNFANADGLLARLYQTSRQVAAAEGAAASVGAPGVGTAGVVMGNVMGRSKKEPITKLADNLLSSPEFIFAAKEYAGSNIRAGQSRAAATRADRALRRSNTYNKWLEALAPDERRQVMRVGLMAYLSGGDNAEVGEHLPEVKVEFTNQK